MPSNDQALSTTTRRRPAHVAAEVRPGVRLIPVVHATSPAGTGPDSGPSRRAPSARPAHGLPRRDHRQPERRHVLDPRVLRRDDVVVEEDPVVDQHLAGEVPRRRVEHRAAVGSTRSRGRSPPTGSTTMRPGSSPRMVGHLVPLVGVRRTLQLAAGPQARLGSSRIGAATSSPTTDHSASRPGRTRSRDPVAAPATPRQQRQERPAQEPVRVAQQGEPGHDVRQGLEPRVPRRRAPARRREDDETREPSAAAPGRREHGAQAADRRQRAGTSSTRTALVRASGRIDDFQIPPSETRLAQQPRAGLRPRRERVEHRRADTRTASASSAGTSQVRLATTTTPRSQPGTAAAAQPEHGEHTSGHHPARRAADGAG